MQGIGSDPNYKPSTGAAASGGIVLSADEIAAQLADTSKKAISLFSTVWETTAKVSGSISYVDKCVLF